MTIFDLITLSLMGIGMGFSLMGISTAVLFSPFIVAIYGSRMGNGIMFLPFFIADLYVSWQYRKNFDKSLVLKLIPFSLAGMVGGSLLANNISEDIFRKVVGCIIIFSSILFFLKKYEHKLTKMGWFFGIFGGASSYLANVSGPIFNVYLLSYKQEEEAYIGTRAVFFSVLNFLKFFLYLFIFRNINSFTLSRGAVAVPFIFIGVALARVLLSKIKQHTFNLIIVLLSLVAAFALLF